MCIAKFSLVFQLILPSHSVSYFCSSFKGRAVQLVQDNFYMYVRCDILTITTHFCAYDLDVARIPCVLYPNTSYFAIRPDPIGHLLRQHNHNAFRSRAAKRGVSTSFKNMVIGSGVGIGWEGARRMSLAAW